MNYDGLLILVMYVSQYLNAVHLYEFRVPDPIMLFQYGAHSNIKSTIVGGRKATRRLLGDYFGVDFFPLALYTASKQKTGKLH